MAEEKHLPWGLKPDSLAPGSMKNLSDDKLKAFNIGSMNVKKIVTKKEMDEIKKKKEIEETNEVYKEFVEAFENNNKGINKSWVKGGLVNPEKGESKPTNTTTKLYKPTSKLLDKKTPAPEVHSIKKEEKNEKPPSLKKKGLLGSEKKKSNLELFKEELKVIQEERMERKKIRHDLGFLPSELSVKKTVFDPEPIASGLSMGIQPIVADDIRFGMMNYENDTNTTNLYLGNLNPKMTEQQICEIFGKYGPLASVKVMWPRTDEEKARGRNCGFVAFMNRKDGERALANLQGKDIMEFEMKLGWGKSVIIPPHPIYIPPALSELTLPPPPSGLPFNAQPLKQFDHNDDHKLQNCLVKVVIPTEKTLLCIIHRVIEFVVREGPMFEAMIMNRELQNPLFRFLFENQSPAHVYYRWKLFSILQGDSPYSWRGEEFQMFKGGSIWRPPPRNPFAQGMPEELISSSSKPPQKDEETTNKKILLSDSQRDKLEDLLRDLTPERKKIGSCMVWCIQHAESAAEIVDCIVESLSITETPIPKKIARLFLISDLLHNSSARVFNASYFRRFFEQRLHEVFKHLHDTHIKIDARLKAEQFKQKVMSCFRAWEDWTIYTSDFLINLQNIFLGLTIPKGFLSEDAGQLGGMLEGLEEDNDVDGIPLDDLDGIPMEKQPFDSYSLQNNQEFYSLEKKNKVLQAKPTFVPSKWEAVDEADLENQAMTVSKWDTLEQKNQEKKEISIVDYDDDDIDGIPLEEQEESLSGEPLIQSALSLKDVSESERIDISGLKKRYEKNEGKRAKLREIELKVLKYQDDLEGDKRIEKRELMSKVDQFRQSLLKKEFHYDDLYNKTTSSSTSSSKPAYSKHSFDKKKEDDFKYSKKYKSNEEQKSGKESDFSSKNKESQINKSPSNAIDQDENRRRKRKSKSPRRKKSRSKSGSPAYLKSKKNRH